ncbi:unnamed protein product, partial [Scytosiphon promiscuus]
MICGNAALLYESPDESSGRSLKFSRSIMGRFRRDSSLDRATHLKEARDRRSGYLADLEKRDQDRERGGDRYSGEDRSSNYEERSTIVLLKDSVGSSAVGNHQRQQRKLYDEPLRAAPAAAHGTSNTGVIHPGGPTSGSPSRGGSQSSPMFHRPSTRSPRPKRPSTTPARAKSPPRLGGNGSPPKENRQSATERAARIYRAGAGSVGSLRRPTSPARSGTDGSVFKPQPPWSNRIPPKSPAERSPRRLSPREHGRHPLLWPPDESCTVRRGQALPEVPRYGDVGSGNSDGIGDCRRRPIRPATTGGGPSQRFSRPMSAFSGRWDKDESFPDKPPANISSESREARHVLSGAGHSSRSTATVMAAATREHEPRSPSKERDCSTPLGACPRARSAEEMPAIQRARHLELQRLAIEKKELEAQLAEVKKLMRARKARPNAALIGLLDAAAGSAPKTHRGERLTRRRRERRRRKPRRSLAEPSPEYSGVVRRAIRETRQGPLRGQEENETFDTSTEHRVSSGERGRETRRRPHKARDTRTGSHGTNSDRRRTPEHAGKKAVAFNTTVPAERPATAGVVRADHFPRGRESGSGREGSRARRRTQRPESASRRSRSAPSPSMHRTDGLPTPSNNEYTKKEPGDARQVGRRKGGGGKTRTRVDYYDSRSGRSGDVRDDEKRRVYFSKFPIRGDRLPAAMNGGVERKGGGQSASIFPPRSTNSRERLIDGERSHSSSFASYLEEHGDEDAAIKESVNYYEDDFEVVSARGSYESDFEAWENSKSDFELREQSASVEGCVAAPEGKQVLALEDGGRRPRVEAITDKENQQEVRDRRSHPPRFDESGDECSEPSADDLLRVGENWGDGRHIPAASRTRVDSGGAASWKEWNQPDDRPALSDEWGTTLPKPAATHQGSVEGSAEFAAGFDYLWVEDYDDMLVRGAKAKAGGTKSPYSSRDDHDKRPDRAHASASGEERFCVLTSGAKSPPPHSERADKGRGVKPNIRREDREDERVSTASLSDGGASLYDILVSSPDERDSDETWSLESYDRRDDEAAALSMTFSRAGASVGVRPLQDAKPSSNRRIQDESPAKAGNLLPAAKESSDGSSLYDMTSPASDVDDDMTLGREDALRRRLVGRETAGQATTSRHPVDAAGKIGYTQDEVSHGSHRDAQASPSDVKVETVALGTVRIETVEKMPSMSNAPLLGQRSVGVMPTSFDEVDDENPARKGPLPQHPFTVDVDGVGGLRGGNAVVDGHELEYNGSYDEYSLDGGSGSPTDGVAAHGNDDDAETKIAGKRHIDEPSTGDRSNHRSVGLAGGGYQLNDRHKDGVKPARGQGATPERGHGPTLESEESLDQLFALGERGETYRDYRPSEGGGSLIDASRLSARKGEPSDGESRTEQSSGEVITEAEEPHVVRSRIRGGSSAGAEGKSTINSSQLVMPEQSLNGRSSLGTQGARYEDDNLGTSTPSGAGQGSSADDGGAFAEEVGGSVGGNRARREAEGFLEELSSLEKNGDSDTGEPTTQVPAHADNPPIVEDANRGARNAEIGAGSAGNSSQLAPEESLDELSSLDKQGQPREDGNLGTMLPQPEVPSVGESINRGMRSGAVGEEGIAKSSHLEPEESLDELSSLGKQGELYKDENLGATKLSSKEGRSSDNSGGIFAGAEGLPETIASSARHTEEGHGRVASSSHLEAEGSLDELSSLEKEGGFRVQYSTEEVSAQAQEAPIVENGNRSIGSAGVGDRGIADSRQQAPEESLDELSSLDKQGDTHNENDAIPRGKQPPAENNHYQDAPSVGGGQSRIADGVRLEGEESLDELSSLERQGENPQERSADERYDRAEDTFADKNSDCVTRMSGLGEVGTFVHRSQVATEESLDGLSSQEKRGDIRRDRPEVSTVRGQPNSHQAKQPIPGNGGLINKLMPGRSDSFLSPSAQPVADENGSLAQHEGRESLDEYLFDSEGASSLADLPSLGDGSSGGGLSRGHKTAVSGNGSSSSEKHSLDQSLGGLSSADEGNSQLCDDISLAG